MSITAKNAQGFNFRAYIDIFTREAGLVFLCLIVILTLSYYIIARKKNVKFTLGDTFAFVLLIVAQRDLNHSKASKCVKIAFLSNVLFGFLTYSYYTAFLTSLMAVEPRKLRIRSFQDVLDGDRSVYFLKATAQEDLLKYSPKDSAMHKVYLKSIQNE